MRLGRAFRRKRLRVIQNEEALRFLMDLRAHFQELLLESCEVGSSTFKSDTFQKSYFEPGVDSEKAFVQNLDDIAQFRIKGLA